ncbi:MAG: response regulator [Tannerellaceae bacterium]|jgi:signal transduction histidine kinase/CheY-like chemotaxis protein|nr:response regulator [Tannerellaceae bacterium]
MFKMQEHLTRRVLLGYASIILLAICTVAYIFNLIARIAGETESGNTAREKVYVVTNALSLLYESETHTHFIGMAEDELNLFHSAMEKVHEQMQVLRTYTTDSAQSAKIEKIEGLLVQKSENIQQLYAAWQESERLYAKNIAKAMTTPQKPVEQVEVVQSKEEIKKDTVVVQRQKRSFFKRVAEVFAPVKEDTTIVVNATSKMQRDSLVSTYNPSDTIASVLKKLQSNIAGERIQLNQKLSERLTTLRYNNNVITNEINQILLGIEEEEMANSLGQAQMRQEMLHDASRTIANIAVVAIIVTLIFLYLILRDILRSRYYRKHLEKAKQYAESLLQSRERLMLMISHDIRAPLSSILGHIDLMMEDKPRGKQREYLENMSTSSNHILSLVNDLLDFHRLESGQVEVHPAPFHIPALFEEIHSSFKPAAEQKKLSLDLHIDAPGDTQTYLGDAIRIRQAIGNLLSNAIKFTWEGHVALSVSVTPETAMESRLTVSVKDDGPGIPEAEQSKIFAAFTRLAGAEKTEGFGLGLSITGKLIALMGGEITLDSAEGKGSEFTVTLPLPLSDGEIEPDDGKAPAPSGTAEQRPAFPEKETHCLLVDDDVLQLKMIEELLKRHAIKVTTCTNPNKVIDSLSRSPFDIIITDIQMPGLEGYSLLKQIRASGVPGADTIPVVAASASIAEKKAHYEEAGFSGFLNKPFTSVELLSLMNELLTAKAKPKRAALDIAALTLFADGDEEAIAGILKTCSEETGKNIRALETALAAKDRAEASGMAHKLVPLFTLLKAPGLETLKAIEKNDDALPDEEWRRLMEEAIAHTRYIVEEVNAHSVE